MTLFLRAALLTAIMLAHGCTAGETYSKVEICEAHGSGDVFCTKWRSACWHNKTNTETDISNCEGK